jgi:hypothetical protein
MRSHLVNAGAKDSDADLASQEVRINHREHFAIARVVGPKKGSSAVDHPLRGLRIPSPLHRNLGHSVLDLAEVALGEFDDDGGDILL